jgi:hypothetical protein
MSAARVLQLRPSDETQIDCVALEGMAFQALVGCLVEELEQSCTAIGATATQLASVLREVSERCSDDTPDQQADALSHLLIHAHELLAGAEHIGGEAAFDARAVPSDELDAPAVLGSSAARELGAERSPSILPESGVVRRSTLRSPSEPGRSEPGPSEPGLPGAPGQIQIAAAAHDFDDETEVTMPAITRMNVSVFDDDETEHTMPGVAPASKRRNGLRLG